MHLHMVKGPEGSVQDMQWAFNSLLQWLPTGSISSHGGCRDNQDQLRQRTGPVVPGVPALPAGPDHPVPSIILLGTPSLQTLLLHTLLPASQLKGAAESCLAPLLCLPALPLG